MTDVDISPEEVERVANYVIESRPYSPNVINAAATLRALSVALTQSLAETAAVIERAAMVADYEATQCGPSYGNGYPRQSALQIATTIRALKTPDQTAALDADIIHLPMSFGFGAIVVDTGTYFDTPAVFIRAAHQPGTTGDSAQRENGNLNAVERGELIFTFPTVGQAQLVADALVGSAIPEGYAE